MLNINLRNIDLNKSGKINVTISLKLKISVNIHTKEQVYEVLQVEDITNVIDEIPMKEKKVCDVENDESKSISSDEERKSINASDIELEQDESEVLRYYWNTIDKQIDFIKECNFVIQRKSGELFDKFDRNIKFFKEDGINSLLKRYKKRNRLIKSKKYVNILKEINDCYIHFNYIFYKHCNTMEVKKDYDQNFETLSKYLCHDVVRLILEEKRLGEDYIIYNTKEQKNGDYDNIGIVGLCTIDFQGIENSQKMKLAKIFKNEHELSDNELSFLNYIAFKYSPPSYTGFLGGLRYYSNATFYLNKRNIKINSLDVLKNWMFLKMLLRASYLDGIPHKYKINIGRYNCLDFSMCIEACEKTIMKMEKPKEYPFIKKNK